MKISSFFKPITHMFTKLSKSKLSKSILRVNKPKVRVSSEDTFIRATPASIHLVSSKADLPATSAVFKAYNRAKQDRAKRIANPVVSPSFEAEMARLEALSANFRAAKLFYDGAKKSVAELQSQLHQAEQKLGTDSPTVIDLKKYLKVATKRLDKACADLITAEMATF